VPAHISANLREGFFPRTLARSASHARCGKLHGRFESAFDKCLVGDVRQFAFCQVSLCVRTGSRLRCIRSTLTEIQSTSKNGFECFGGTRVNTLGTISPHGRGAAFTKTGSESTKQHCGCWCGGDPVMGSRVLLLRPPGVAAYSKVNAQLELHAPIVAEGHIGRTCARSQPIRASKVGRT